MISPNTVLPTRKIWWTRPCGGFDVMRLAVPMIISAGSITLMTFTDRMFLTWVHLDAMTASMQAGLIFWALLSLPHATAAYTNAFVSQYHGCGHNERIGPVVWQGLFFAAILSPLFILAEPFFHTLLDGFQHKPELAELERKYLHIILWGAGAGIGSEALAAFYYGRGKMYVVMAVNIFCVLANVVLDYALIFGYLGFPRLELEGAAYATVACQWLRIVLLLLLIAHEDFRADKYGFRKGFGLNFPLLGRLLYYGVPGGIPVFGDATAFMVFVLLIATEGFAGTGLGAKAAGASTIAFTLNTFTFMPIVGTGVAVTTLVGNQIGSRRPDRAERATLTALVLIVLYAGVFGLLFVTIPNTLLAPFAAYAEDPVAFDEIRPMTINLLWFVALYLFFDAVCILSSSALKGAGDTWFVMIASVVFIPMLPLLSFFGIYFFGFGLYWCWSALSFWAVLMAVVFSIRFAKGKWKKMQVIEREMIEHSLPVDDNIVNPDDTLIRLE